jgi:malonyl-CoA/methylmalonyl-CoA synthetase
VVQNRGHRRYTQCPPCEGDTKGKIGLTLPLQIVINGDDGYQILGRASVDIIKSGGYKISALEIEAVLLDHPQIAECAVIGVPDAHWGEVVTAIIAQTASNNKSDLKINELREWCKNRLAPYKIPKQIWLVDAIPRNAMLKVNKKDLLARYLKQYEQQARQSKS